MIKTILSMLKKEIIYEHNFGYYDNYSREKVSIFDAIANICALVSTLYGVVTFIFCGFYSNSFDNYKIIEKIISRGAYLDIKDIKDIREDSPTKKIGGVVLDKFNITLKPTDKILADDEIILVDTNYLEEIPKSIIKDNIVEVIDHHNRAYIT